MKTDTIAPDYKGYRFPPEIISHAVWLYFRFSLRFRDVEELMAQRGIILTYETVRKWCLTFGQTSANELRRRRPRCGDKWHLDEVFLKNTLHVVVSIPDPVVAPTPEVIGVDLGLTHPAVTSSRHFLGERRWKEQERRLFRLRRKLQSKGTRSARRHLRKLSGKLLRQRRDHDHVLSKRLVHSSPAGSTIVFENLTHIRSRAKMKKHTDSQRRLHSWSFAQLYCFTAYKAQEKGISVAKVDPRHTSQTCSHCGHQARNNRRSQSLFLCRTCGYCLSADLNASYNIRDKHLASLGMTSASGLPVKQAIVSDLRV